ncbi:hypothetical protein E1286_20970 [Nonomuraea terrae]|uniref:WD40 repeat domain-containing protein n=1 Tax=Nonomuraea terrae TaxID=2530383 RepID=A0A4R4YN80_9ACTN|nr:hypothetical protein [Nonomuraea terrae]TDD46453.1 hypothetical protein E1286_20970 [Nonomuraea terrae]
MKHGLLALLMVLTVCALPGTSYADTGEENLGQPIANRILSQEQSQGVDADGRPQAYWVTAGNSYMNAMFQATDIRSGEVVFKQRVPDGGTDSWANTFSAADGTVYFAMTSGQMYRWKPGDAAITSLGTPFPGEGVWRLAAAPDGVVYGGTYPGGLLFSYDPGTGEFTDHGQIVPGETYGRALAVDDTSVYFGTQPRARLARFDRATGQVEQIPLPAEYGTSEVVYDMTRARDLLLLRVQPSNDLLFYDTAGKTFVNVVKGISARAVSTPDPTGKYVYFRIAADGIVQYDLDTHTYTPVGWGPNAFPGTWAWIELNDPDFPGRSLSMTYYYGRIYIWNPQTEKTRYLGESGLEGSANPIQAIGAGPGGEVYAGGFLSPPGISRFDPATGAYTLLSSGGQVEGFGRYGDHVVYGRYPNGELLDYDPAEPWTYGTNPAPVTIGEEQDRPQAFVQVGDRVAVGSVPKSGRLGGALTLWDPRTRALDVHRDVVPGQSVVSLATRDGLVYGGTSIHGGYGIDPAATSARLFVFDPVRGELVSSVVPVEGAHSVNALTVDAKGRIWGLADGHLFTYLPEAKRVTRAAALFPRQSSRYGADRALVFRGNDLYAAMAGSLWRIDVRTWKATALAGDGVSQLVTGGDGHLYFFRGTELFRRRL